MASLIFEGCAILTTILCILFLALATLSMVIRSDEKGKRG